MLSCRANSCKRYVDTHTGPDNKGRTRFPVQGGSAAQPANHIFSCVDARRWIIASRHTLQELTKCAHWGGVGERHDLEVLPVAVVAIANIPACVHTKVRTPDIRSILIERRSTTTEVFGNEVQPGAALYTNEGC